MAEIALESMLKRIEQADSIELNELTKAICRRYRAVHPDSEVSFLSIPKNDPNERKAIRDWLIKNI